MFKRKNGVSAFWVLASFFLESKVRKSKVGKSDKL